MRLLGSIAFIKTLQLDLKSLPFILSILSTSPSAKLILSEDPISVHLLADVIRVIIIFLDNYAFMFIMVIGVIMSLTVFI